MASSFASALRGYDRDEVDRLVDAVEQTTERGDDASRARARSVLHSAAFRVRLSGYDRSEVDRWCEERLRELG